MKMVTYEGMATPEPGPRWRVRIEQARERGHFTGDDVRRASHWDTCMCGQQDVGIPRFERGQPKDGRLTILGLDFKDAVDNNDFDRAEHVGHLIESRAAEVLAMSDEAVDEAIRANENKFTANGSRCITIP
jgi:hypothetical protein